MLGAAERLSPLALINEFMYDIIGEKVMVLSKRQSHETFYSLLTGQLT